MPSTAWFEAWEQWIFEHWCIAWIIALIVAHIYMNEHERKHHKHDD